MPKGNLDKKKQKMLFHYASIKAPYSFLPEGVREWLETGGLDELRKEKPLLAEWIEKMNREISFPRDLGLAGSFSRKVETKMKEKGCLKEDEFIYQSEITNLFRFRYDPLRTKSDRIYCLAKTIIEILSQKIKENPERQDLKEVKKVFAYWIALNDKVRHDEE